MRWKYQFRFNQGECQTEDHNEGHRFKERTDDATNEHHWRERGDGGQHAKSCRNRDAVGARLELTVGDRTLVREVNPYGSFQSQSAYEVHFGLGQATQAERLVIRWPSGTVDEITGLQAGSFRTVEEGESRRN